MTLTTLHTLSDEPEPTVTLMVAEELRAMQPQPEAELSGELPAEFYPLSLRETFHHLTHWRHRAHR